MCFQEIGDLGEKKLEKVDWLGQYGRKQNLKIAGKPIKGKENPNNMITEIVKLVKMKITPDKISTSHRLQEKPKCFRSLGMMSNESPPTPSSIIIRFLNRDVRNQLYSK